MKFFIEIANALSKRFKMPQIAFEEFQIIKTACKPSKRLYGRYNEIYRQRLTFHEKFN